MPAFPPLVRSYWWFVATAQQMTLTGLIIDVALSGLKNTKASWVGMFSIMVRRNRSAV